MFGKPVNDDVVKSILENADWGAYGLETEKDAPKIDEGTKEVKKEKKAKVEEDVEVPVCPVCHSQLDEYIEDETLFERVSAVVEIFEKEYSGDEDEDENEDEDELAEDDEDAEENEEDEEVEEEE